MAMVFVYPKTGSFFYLLGSIQTKGDVWQVGEKRCVPSGSAFISVITTRKLVVSKC